MIDRGWRRPSRRSARMRLTVRASAGSATRLIYASLVLDRI